MMAVSEEAKQAWRKQLAEWRRLRRQWLNLHGSDAMPEHPRCKEFGCVQLGVHIHRWVNSDTGEALFFEATCVAHHYPRNSNYARARVREDDGSLTTFVQVKPGNISWAGAK